jgi:DNA-binding transcriptional LysR family regulator
MTEVGLLACRGGLVQQVLREPRDDVDAQRHTLAEQAAAEVGIHAQQAVGERRHRHVRPDQIQVFDRPAGSGRRHGGPLVIQAAMDGAGLAFLADDRAQPYLDSGALERVLEDWSPPFPGFFLYYPSRRQQPAALTPLIETLRYRA